MRFVTFGDATGPDRAGILAGEFDAPEPRVFDLGHPACADALGGVRPDLLAMIEAGLLSDERWRAARGDATDEAYLPLSSVELRAPLPTPPRIVGALHNYRCAVDERGIAAPAAPSLFEKSPATVIAPNAPVVLPSGAGGITYEAELAVVIGRRAEGVSLGAALDYVAGYTLFNDVSASEIIRAEGSFERGKNFPTFGPMGPFLATAEAFDPEVPARVTMQVGDIRRQDGTTADLLYGVAALISHLSTERPLMPGTVIATGTPAGVAPVQVPPTWLRPGDTMVVSIDGLGRLWNPVLSEEDPHAR